MTWLQQWLDVLFVHVPVASAALARHLPRGLELDTYYGQAFISLVSFRLKLRPALFPTVPGLCSLLELNVRTYVSCEGRPGIIFLRMYADNRLAIAGARLLTPLCYRPARMTHQSAGARYEFGCQPRAEEERFAVSATIAGDYQPARPDSLAGWLVERYTLFVATAAGLVAGDVTHAPWKISAAAGDSLCKEMAARFAGVQGDCLLQHSPGVAATFHPFRPVQPNVAGRYCAAGAAGGRSWPSTLAAVCSSNL